MAASDAATAGVVAKKSRRVDGMVPANLKGQKSIGFES